MEYNSKSPGFHGRVGKAARSLPETPLQQFEDDERQLPITPQISRMMRYV